MQKHDDLIRLMTEVADSDAGTEQGHGRLSAAEEEALLADLTQVIQFRPGSTVLEAAAGVGAITHPLAKLVGPQGRVIATGLSSKALARNIDALPPEFRPRVTPIAGDIHDPRLLDSASCVPLDYITCSNGVVTFLRPLGAFENWYRWLKPGGRVVILGGMWTKESWSGRWGRFVEHLPLSCLQSSNAIVLLLRRAGFLIAEDRLLAEVNQWYRSTRTFSHECQRFIVIASKTLRR